MQVPKIRLSPAEVQLMQNAEVILTKNRVLEKIRGLLEAVQHRQWTMATEAGQEELFRVSPKISRGENYEGLPYLVLDFPRVSSGSDLFFIRQMFWWGKFFSTTLHLSGRYKWLHEESIRSSHPLLSGYFVGISDDPWKHHFEAANYSAINGMDGAAFVAAVQQHAHLKIATRWTLDSWSETEERMWENWCFLLSLCGQLPRR